MPMEMPLAIEPACAAYHQQVLALTDATQKTSKLSDKQAVLALLRSRDHIQTLIDQSAKDPTAPEIPPALLMGLSQDDAEVGKWNTAIGTLSELAAWRKSINPPTHHWWWDSAAPEKPWREWLLGGLTIALLTLCLALARDISTRFFTGAPGIWSSVGAIAPAALALFATGGALTKVGKQLIEAVLEKRGRSRQQWPFIKFGLAALVTALLFGGHSLGLPWAATRYNTAGQDQYFQGKLTSAQANFQRALQLHPDFPEANHGLALTFEDLRDFESAKAEYVKAVNAGQLSSVSNLARLHILDEDYESAAVLLITALNDEDRDKENTALTYAIHKNLGWTWLRQERLADAENQLVEANRLEPELETPQPDGYCLLGELLEQKEEVAAAKAQWETCSLKIQRPEDDVWAGMARKALARIEADSRTEVDETDSGEG